MSILWERSLVPWLDANGNPYSGAKAYFFDASTTTPQIVYTDASLSNPHDHPVVANSAGAFPPIFLVEQSTYRLRITTAADVTIWDVDNISVPTTVAPDPPSGGTANEFLYQTGDIKTAWRTTAPTGYVRLNGRSIGGASSAASERANTDCQALFLHLWTEDANLAVSGGRGASAAGDWAAAKTIALPDWRDRTPVGLGGMGNTKSTLIADSQTNGDTDALGTLGGEGKHALTIPELPAHSHGVTDPGHSHSYNYRTGLSNQSGSDTPCWVGTVSTASGTSTTGITIDNAGTGTTHNNLQPSVFVPFFIKL